MGAERIDEIFKSALSDKESEVGSDSWSKLEMMLDNQPAKKKGAWALWSIAASVSVLLLLGWLYWDGLSQKKTPQLASDRVPTPEIVMESKPIPESKEEVVESVALPVLPKTPINTPTVIPPSVMEVKTEPEYAVEKVLQVEEMALEVDEVEVSKEVLPIRITYKKGNGTNEEITVVASANDTTSKHKMKELLHQAKDFDPGNVWADIRDAKERVMDDPFGLQKEQRQKLK